MPMKFLYAIGFIVLLSLIMSWWNKRQKSTFWSGVVTDIRHSRKQVTRDQDRKPDDWVTIFFRTDTGSEDKIKMRFRIFQQFYPGLAPGERLVKPVGQFYPQRASEKTSEDEPLASGNESPAESPADEAPSKEG